MRLLTGPMMLNSQGGHSASYGMVTRERKGFASSFTVGDSAIQRVVGERIFTPDELYRIYQICPDVRAPIDKVSLRVSNTPYFVQPMLKKTDRGYERAYNMCQAVIAFLMAPNADDDWTTFAQKWAQDSLIYDAYAVERVLTMKGQLQELLVWRGGDVTPLCDEHNRRYGFRQDAALHGPVRFLPEDLDYGNLFANTTYPNGQPLIETLVEEFITMRAQAQHLRRIVDADEIPPGILALVGVSDIALKRFEANMQAKAGQDDKLKIVGVEEGNGKVDWIQLRRSLKDNEWLPNIKEVRKTIWRLFHVTPVTMGETENTPRASAEVQVEIADQGLIGPMLRKMERLVNERWIPLILGNPELAKLVWFGFDLTPDLSQQDQKVRAERLAALINVNVITANEARDELGYDPLVEGDATQDGGSDPEDDVEEEGDGEDAVDPVENKHPRPGVLRVRPDVIRSTAVQFRRDRRGRLITRGDLPSDWQPAGRFKGKRTLPLSDLGDLVQRYDDVVTPLYLVCARNVLREATEAVSDGVLTSAEGTKIIGAVVRETGKLIDAWNADTTTLYEGAAQLGAETGESWDGASVAWRSTAATFQAGAIAYLSATGQRSGIVGAIRREISDLILATMSRSPTQRLSQLDEAKRAKSQLPEALGAFLEAVRRVFERHQHRISNWSGKLVELAHVTVRESLQAATPPQVTAPESAPDRWMVEWVEVSDDNTCSTCRAEGLKDFRPLSELTTTPGGATECGARCRCVLVFWRESEVQSGEAKRLGPIRSRRLPRRG